MANDACVFVLVRVFVCVCEHARVGPKMYFDRYRMDPVSETAAEFAKRNPMAMTVLLPNPDVASVTVTILPVWERKLEEIERWKWKKE